MRILASDPVAEKGLNILREEGFIVDEKIKLSEEELIKIIPQYDALIVRSETKVTARIIEAAENLKIIGRAGVGVDNIDLAAASKKGIIVVNSPEGNTIAAAEHTIALMMALLRNIPQAHAALKAGKWLRKEFTGYELRGKTVGIIGLGRIGTAVAKRVKAFETRVIGYDPFISEERAQMLGITLMPLEELLQNADIVTMHLPLNNETRNLINRERLKLMKKSAFIINCARGGIIDEEALYEALKAGEIAGAALDVFAREPLTESPLFELQNVIVTPHLGASTKEAQINVAIDVAREIANVLKGGLAQNAVNFPAMDKESYQRLKPYINLAEKLGNFLAQILSGGLLAAEIVYNGLAFKEETRPLTLAALKGLLDPLLMERVNYVNAPVVAKERGIKVRETVMENGADYTNLITLKVTTEKGERIIAGTLFRNNEPRIVQIDQYRVDVVPEGYKLFVPHKDQPLMIGRVGLILGEKGINIAGMQLGRLTPGGDAVMVLSLDHPADGDSIKAIAEIPGIYEVKAVSL